MDALSANERSEFRSAASAFLAARERIELLKVQAAEVLGESRGVLQLPNEQVDPILKLGHQLQDILVQIQIRHPGLPGIRFRGHIFCWSICKGRVLGIQILQEADITTVEG